jgi:large subunit ribosomal protein L10
MSTSSPSGDSKDVQLTSKGRPVPQGKLEKIGYLVSLFEKYEFVALLRTEQIGSKQFQIIKKALRPKAIIHMARNTLMERALKIAAEKRKGLDALIPHVEGSCAFAFTNISPFELNDLLQQNKAKAPAKAGSVSPIDIEIPAGNTGFPPGPLISELGQVGLKTRVQGGSIWITADHVIVKAGDTVSRAQALVLSRLGLEPYVIWLKISVAYDSGTILSAEVFGITKSDILDQLHSGSQASLALALSIGYASDTTIPILLQRAHTEAKSLALSIGIITSETAPDILAQVEQQATSLAHTVKSKNPDAHPN